MDKLTVYTRNNCGFCMMAKTLLKNKNIDFTEINIEEDVTGYNFVVAEGHQTVPQIYQNGTLYVEGGFDGLRQKLNEEIVNTAELGSL